MSRRAIAGLSLLSATLLAPLTACSEAESAAQASPQSSDGNWEDDNGSLSPESTQPSVEQVPELYETEAVAAEQGKTLGSRTVEFAPGKKGDALIVAVRCQGKGTIDVTVRPSDVTFPLECLDGEVSTTYNQVDVPGVEKKGTVSVEAPSTIQWSMTVGRGEAAAENEQEAGEPQ